MIYLVLCLFSFFQFCAILSAMIIQNMEHLQVRYVTRLILKFVSLFRVEDFDFTSERPVLQAERPVLLAERPVFLAERSVLLAFVIFFIVYNFFTSILKNVQHKFTSVITTDINLLSLLY